jgi:PleD family two-component response regulator
MNMPSASPATPARADLPRVLVVDHHKTNLAVLGRRIGEAGYRVTAADGGDAALAALHHAPADLILAELYMPRMSGAEFVRIVRSETVWRDIPVLLITGRSDPDGAVRAYEAGADDVILKPFHFEVLFARIERRIARARALQSLRNDNAALDARVVRRAIELGELRDRLGRSEAERHRLQQLVGRNAA